MTTKNDIINRRFPYVGQPDVNGPVTVHWFDVIKAVDDALAAPRAPMSEDEILKRGRRAAAIAYDQWAAKGPPRDFTSHDIEKGNCDTWFGVRAAFQALTDLDKPLTPTIDEQLATIVDSFPSFGSDAARLRAIEVAKAAYKLASTDAH